MNPVDELEHIFSLGFGPLEVDKIEIGKFRDYCEANPVLEPGEELDLLVAKKVMGYDCQQDGWVWLYGERRFRTKSFNPSTEMCDADDLRYEVARLGFRIGWEDDLCGNYHPIVWESKLTGAYATVEHQADKIVFGPIGSFDYDHDPWVKSKEHALCLAALKAVELSESSK